MSIRQTRRYLPPFDEYKASYYRVFGLPVALLVARHPRFGERREYAILRLRLIARWAYLYSCDGLAAMQLPMIDREEMRTCLVKALLEDIAHHLDIDLMALAEMAEQIATDLEQNDLTQPTTKERTLAGTISAITENLNRGRDPRTQLAAA